MSRNLDPSLAAALPDGAIQPVVLAALTFKSGMAYVWSGVGDLVYGGNTYKGLGMLGRVSPITEGSDVQADGITAVLSGIGASPFVASVPTGVTPPVTPTSGQYIVWSTPGAVATNYSGNGSIAATLSTADIVRTGSIPADTQGNRATWSDFPVSSLPADAVIDAIYPVALITGIGDGGARLSTFPIPADNSFSGQYNASSLGNTLAVIEAASAYIAIVSSVPGASFSDEIKVSFVGLAIYYSSASNAISLLNEALSDIQLGAPAEIYFGLMANGALIGDPYPVFAGQVDQPTVDVDTQSSSISLALENKLSNLARPSARRYTAADQHIAYPTDIGFNWVETLNDIALRWGA